MNSFMQGPQTIFIKWSMSGQPAVPEDGCCQCPQRRLCPTQPPKGWEGTRIPLMEPEIMVSGEHKYPWVENMYIWRRTLLEERPRKDFASVAPLRPIHMPGKRIGELSLHLLTQLSPMRSLHAEPFFAQLLCSHQSKPIWWPQFGHLS